MGLEAISGGRDRTKKKVSLDTAHLTIRSRRWIGFRLALPNVLFDVVMNAPNKMKLSPSNR